MVHCIYCGGASQQCYVPECVHRAVACRSGLCIYHDLRSCVGELAADKRLPGFDKTKHNVMRRTT